MRSRSGSQRAAERQRPLSSRDQPSFAAVATGSRWAKRPQAGLHTRAAALPKRLLTSPDPEDYEIMADAVAVGLIAAARVHHGFNRASWRSRAAPAATPTTRGCQ